jgi:uncharacterized protein YhdP
MRILASKGAVLDVRASSVRASIPDLFHGDVRVGVEVHAEDKTSDFLRFIAESPVTKALDGITESMSAAGAGRLALQLDVPIRNPETFKLAGEFQLVENEIRTDSDAPPFSHLNGRFEFTESAITARALNAQFLGGLQRFRWRPAPTGRSPSTPTEQRARRRSRALGAGRCCDGPRAQQHGRER